jgi:crotonobetainyl-CoA:carnitine CoA-transferase CaiB-like acyl-CoA transferase
MSEGGHHGEAAGPLSGLVVLDPGQAAVGPVTASYLGMLGATVIKVDSPRGDSVRHNSPQQRPLQNRTRRE